MEACKNKFSFDLGNARLSFYGGVNGSYYIHAKTENEEHTYNILVAFESPLFIGKEIGLSRQQSKQLEEIACKYTSLLQAVGGGEYD